MCSLQHSAVRHGKNAKKQFGRHPFHFVNAGQLDLKDATPMGRYPMNAALIIAVHSRWTGMTHELESSWPK